MHMADALVSSGVAGTMYACSAVAAGFSLKKIKTDDLNQKVPLMGVMGAFVFAAQMINFTIPGTGSSGHLTGGMMLSALLGPQAGFLTMVAVLLIQCLVFADGGLLALGCNIWNMGFYGCFVGYLIWRMFMRGGMSSRRIIMASLTGCVLALQLGALSVTLETLTSGITELPFTVFLGFMQPVHLAIGLVEGLITAAILLFVFRTRPQLILGYDQSKDSRLKTSTIVSILAAAAIVTGGFLSLFASSNPDGLEWSIERVTGNTEIEAVTTMQHNASLMQEKLALLPDYDIPAGSEGFGTSLSGIAGAFMVLILCVSICLVIRKKKRAAS